jgi:integrase
MSKNTKKKKGNGEGSVYKYKNGYRGQIVVGTDDEGKPIRRSVTGITIKEVNEKLTLIKNSMITGTYIAPDRITLPDLTRQMLKDDLNMNYIRESTHYRHIETLKRIEADPYMRTTPIQQLSYTGVKEYLLTETRAAQSVIDKIYMMIQRTMHEAVKRKIITVNQLEDIRKPKSVQHREKVRALTRDEQIRLYEVLTTEDISYSHQMLLSMLTGMRMGEVNALTVDDINLKMKTISISRTIARDLKGAAFVSQTTKTENGRPHQKSGFSGPGFSLPKMPKIQ